MKFDPSVNDKRDNAGEESPSEISLDVSTFKKAANVKQTPDKREGKLINQDDLERSQINQNSAIDASKTVDGGLENEPSIEQDEQFNNV